MRAKLSEQLGLSHRVRFALVLRFQFAECGMILRASYCAARDEQGKQETGSKGAAGKDESDGSFDTPCALDWAPTTIAPFAPR